VRESVGSLASGDDTNDDGSSDGPSTGDAVKRAIVSTLPFAEVVLDNDDRDRKDAIEKAKEYIRKFSDIDNVIDFLEKHPALATMITAALPGVAIAAWAYENPEREKAFALGTVLGEMGMPGGVAEVSESESPFYLLGYLGLSVTPYIGVLADVRDLVQNSYSFYKTGKLSQLGEATLDAIGAYGSVAGYGVGDAPKVASVVTRWMSHFGSSPVVIKTMGTFLSNSASRAQIRVALDLVSDGSASVLLKRGESMNEVIRYALKGELEENAKILSKRPPSTGTITNDEYLTIVNKGYDKQLVDSLRRRGLSGDQMTKLIDKGVDLKKTKPLVKEGYSGDEILKLVNKGVDPETATPLAKQGATSDDILELVRKDADVDLAAELANDKVPLEDLKYYAKNGNDLGVVKQARAKGTPPRRVKIMFIAKNNKKLAMDWTVTGGGYYALANNYCNWQRQPGVDEKWKAEDFCQTIQISPID
jgi:hypothetical protein